MKTQSEVTPEPELQEESEDAPRSNTSTRSKWGQWLKATAVLGGAYLVLDVVAHEDDSILARLMRPAQSPKNPSPGRAQQQVPAEFVQDPPGLGYTLTS